MHGGDIYSNKIQLDFSVSINPLGMSTNVRHALAQNLSAVEHYPDQKCGKLVHALSQKLKVSETQILTGNGASELIPAVFRALNARRVLAFAPCFTGYKRAFQSANASVQNSAQLSFFNLSYETQFVLERKNLEELKNLLEQNRPDILIVANPNNPDGSVKPLPQMEVLAKLCRAYSTKLLIDECFIELSDNPGASFVPLMARYPEVIVLRAFTKTFALPGLRLGYILCSDENLVEAVRFQLAEWSVSSLAQIAGVAALQDLSALEQARALIKQERQFLCAGLEKLGFSVFSSDCNFILFYSEKQPELYEKLIQKGILIRDCSDFEGLKKGFYRISVKQHTENQRLIEAIKEVLETK